MFFASYTRCLEKYTNKEKTPFILTSKNGSFLSWIIFMLQKGLKFLVVFWHLVHFFSFFKKNPIMQIA